MGVSSILLDTNAYAAFKGGLPDAVDIVRHAPTIAISSIVLGEILGGFAAGTRAVANRRELDLFLASERVILLPVDQGTAEQYSSVYWSLRRKGHPIPTNDMWIAATALQHGLAVYSYDSHFQAVDGVSVGKQLADFTH